MAYAYKTRRVIVIISTLIIFIYIIINNTPVLINLNNKDTKDALKPVSTLAIKELDKIAVKGRAPKTDYSREQFGAGWNIKQGCDTRNIILNRDLVNTVVDEKCNVSSGTLNDPYTGKLVSFIRGSSTSGAVQIDHVVALSDAWQKGAQQLTTMRRIELANDPLELLAVDGAANSQKSDGDAATWLPSNKEFRCQYVARQIAVKQKYSLWVTQAEHDAISDILIKCPGQLLPNP